MTEFLKCPNCSRQFSTEEYLTKHQEEAHGAKDASGMYNCPSCGRGYTSKTDYNVHQRTHYFDKKGGGPQYQKAKPAPAPEPEPKAKKETARERRDREYKEQSKAADEYFSSGGGYEAYQKAQRERDERINSGYIPPSENLEYQNHVFFKPDATEEEIKAEFRRLAMKYHPDKNPAPEAAAAFIRFKSDYDNAISRAQARSRGF